MAHPPGAAILVEPGSHLRMSLAQTLWPSADSDADGKAPLGRGDHVARIARHFCVPYLFPISCHGRFALSSPPSAHRPSSRQKPAGAGKDQRLSLAIRWSRKALMEPGCRSATCAGDPPGVNLQLSKLISDCLPEGQGDE
jgi:hypothetical protein